MNNFKLVTLNDLRQNMLGYMGRVRKGGSFVVYKRSVPVFRVSPVDETDEQWEEAIDFTKIKKGGVKIDELLRRI